MNYLFKDMRTMCWAIVALIILLVSSCKDDDDVVSGFSVDQTEMQFLNNGGTIELKIATDQTWTAEAENDWCMVSPATGVGNGVCVIKADSSYLYKERTGRIIFYSDKGDLAEVLVKQYGYEPTIDFAESEVTVPSYAAPEKAYVDVEAIANVPFEVVIPEEAKAWLTLDGTSTYTPSTTIPRKQKFRFKFKTYSDFDKGNRIAEVQFNQKPLTTNRASGETAMLNKVVKIIQEKAPVIIPSREGDSLAVLAIMRVMNSGTPSASRPIIHWDNVVVEERTYDYYNPLTGVSKKDTTELRVVSFRLSMIDTDETIPYQIKYLTELETFAAIANANGYRKKIALGPEIASLTKLKSLSLMGYGVNSLPAEMAHMQSLEELDLNGNTILSLESIKDVLLGLKNQLKYLDLGSNRVSGTVMNLSTDIPRNETLETIGLGGDLSKSEWIIP